MCLNKRLLQVLNSWTKWKKNQQCSQKAVTCRSTSLFISWRVLFLFFTPPGVIRSEISWHFHPSAECFYHGEGLRQPRASSQTNSASVRILLARLHSLQLWSALTFARNHRTGACSLGSFISTCKSRENVRGVVWLQELAALYLDPLKQRFFSRLKAAGINPW